MTEVLNLKDITIDYLLHSSAGEELEKIQQSVEQAEDTFFNAYYADDKKLLYVKAGTIISFAILKKYGMGIKPSEFTEQDWKDIANSVSKYAVKMDGQKYSEFIFRQYADFIDTSISRFGDDVSENTRSKLSEIHELAEELRHKTKLLDQHKISETAYTEDCLWTALEAMMRLILVAKIRFSADEFTDLAHSLSLLALQMGRYRLYDKENQILDDYNSQLDQLDHDLNQELDEYVHALEEEYNRFNQMINDAFQPDFRNQLMESVEFAKTVGVNESELIKSEKDADDYFS